jgi:hypothetical protein
MILGGPRRRANGSGTSSSSETLEPSSIVRPSPARKSAAAAPRRAVRLSTAAPCRGRGGVGRGADRAGEGGGQEKGAHRPWPGRMRLRAKREETAADLKCMCTPQLGAYTRRESRARTGGRSQSLYSPPSLLSPSVVGVIARKPARLPCLFWRFIARQARSSRGYRRRPPRARCVRERRAHFRLRRARHARIRGEEREDDVDVETDVGADAMERDIASDTA